MALRAVISGSAVEFSPEEMEQHLQRCVEELRIMRSRGNVYFVRVFRLIRLTVHLPVAPRNPEVCSPGATCGRQPVR